MDDVISAVRDLIEDNYQRTEDTFEYLTSKIFTLTESNVDSTSIVVYRNGVVYAPANYTYSSITGKLTVTGTLTVNDILQVVYNAYEKYSTAEMQGYIRSAISYLVIERYKCFIVKPPDIIFPTPDTSEVNLIAIIASILIKGSIRQYRTPDFTISFNDNESKEEKIKKIVRQFQKNYGVIDYIDLGHKQVDLEHDEE